MNKSTIVTFIFYSLLNVVLTSGCTGKDSNTASTYQPTFSANTLEKNTLIFGVPSFAYSETAEDLVKYLNAHLSGFCIKMKACLTYEEYLKLFKQKKFDLTFISGIQAFLQSDSGYTICGKISNDKEYTSVIFSRKSAGIKNVLDLKSKKIALIPGTWFLAQ